MRLFITISAFISFFPLAGDATASSPRETYKEYCSSCHGFTHRGGSAPSLFDKTFAYGSDVDAIEKNISNGIEDVGMPAFAEGLTTEDIRALAEYIKRRSDGPRIKGLFSNNNIDDIRTSSGLSPVFSDYLVPAVVEVPSIADSLHAEDWVKGLDEPWGFVFIDDDLTALVTEKDGKLKRIEFVNGEAVIASEIQNIPVVNSGRQGGLLDVAIDPDYGQNGWVYLTFSHPLEGTSGPSMTKLVRGKIENNQWVDEETLFQAHEEDYIDTGFHYGSRIAFDDEGHLFFSIGDRGPKEQAQDLDRPNGKVHRLNRDGTIPEYNPFIEGKYPSIFSYGNRNPQGLVWHKEDKNLWSTEHGPKGGDELNVITSGTNYGWPKISYGINYNGTILTEHQMLPGMAQPVSHWTPSIAVSGMDVYMGELFPGWRGHLLVGSLAEQSLRLVEVSDSRYINEVEIFGNEGRIRDVTAGPDGAIYVALPEKIVRLSHKPE